MTWIQISGICAMWPWPCRYDLGSRSWHTLESWDKLLCEILSRSNISVRSYGPDTEFGYMCTVTLTLEIWPWLKVMTWPWVMDNNCVKYYPDQTWQWGVVAWTQIFWYVGTVTLEVWPWVKVMTHPWVMENKCVKYYPDPALQWWVMACRQIFSICALWPWPWEIWPCVKVMTHPWFMDNNCVNF